MKYTKRSFLLLLISCFYISESIICTQANPLKNHTKTVFRASTLSWILFPIPSMIYNAGCDESGNTSGYEIRYSSYYNSSFTVYEPGDIKTTFADVAGLDDAKQDIQDVLSYLQNPTRFTDMGAHIPKGILMEGGPGNGKTLLAHAAAGQVNCPFISVKGSDFNSKWAGVGSEKVQELFKTARSMAPCIIFIDEIDAIATTRSNDNGGVARDDNKTLIALLTEMDGLAREEYPIIIFGATNRIDQLDRAIVRPGRFDRVVKIKKPMLKARQELLQIAFAKSPLAYDVNFNTIAHATSGFSGAQLANLANESAIVAINNNSSVITMEHIETAYDNITLGREIKTMQQTKKDLLATAYHEAGHVIAEVFQEKNVMVHKVSITPRGGSLGVSHMIPLKETYDISKDDMLNKIVTCLAGRVAEEEFGFPINSGAANDLEQAQKIAYEMVVTYGMGENSLQDISYSRFGDYLPNDIASQIHRETHKIIEKCRSITKKLITTHRQDIKKIAELLIEKGTVHGAEIYRLLNVPVPKMADF